MQYFIDNALWLVPVVFCLGLVGLSIYRKKNRKTGGSGGGTKPTPPTRPK